MHVRHTGQLSHGPSPRFPQTSQTDRETLIGVQLFRHGK